MGTQNEIQKVDSVSPLAAAAELVKTDGNMDVAKLKELLDVQERWDANQAKKAYVQAMSNFKANPPEILKDKTVKYGATAYKHATLSNVTTCINKALSEHGMTASWVTSQDNGSVKVTCKITHIMGHSEETCLSAPPDTTGSKNAIQAIGSTVTYLQRYTLLALTGLATCDQDDDGAEAGKELKPEIPKLTAQNLKVLDAICVKLQESLPDNEPDKDKVAAIFLAQQGAYPSKIAKVGAAATWLIGLKQKDSWIKEPEDLPEDMFPWHCKDCGADMSEELFEKNGGCSKCGSINVCRQEDRDLEKEKKDANANLPSKTNS